MGESTAQARTASMIRSASTAFGLETSSISNRCCGVRRPFQSALWSTSRNNGWLSRGASLTVLVGNAGIEPCVEEIDQEIRNDEDKRTDDDNGLHDGIVAAKDRLHGEETDSRPGEHGFHHDRPA